MVQYYTIILWRKPESENITFDEIAERAYKTISVYQKLPNNYKPNYLNGTRKKDAKLFDWSYENFANTLQQGANQENGQVFKELGYSIGFFSSLDNNQSCGYSMSVGKTNDLFINSFIVALSIDMDYYLPDTSKLIEDLFKESIKTFGAFYGAVVNSLMDKYIYYDKDANEIKSIHWLNYVAPDITQNIKESKLKKLMKKYKEFEYDNGFIKLQNKAINAENPEEVKYKEELERELL